MHLRIVVKKGSEKSLAKVLYAKQNKPPVVGDVVQIVDKAVHGKPERVKIVEIIVHTGGGDIYVVEHV